MNHEFFQDMIEKQASTVTESCSRDARYLRMRQCENLVVFPFLIMPFFFSIVTQPGIALLHIKRYPITRVSSVQSSIQSLIAYITAIMWGWGDGGTTKKRKNSTVVTQSNYKNRPCSIWVAPSTRSEAE